MVVNRPAKTVAPQPAQGHGATVGGYFQTSFGTTTETSLFIGGVSSEQLLPDVVGYVA